MANNQSSDSGSEVDSFFDTSDDRIAPTSCPICISNANWRSRGIRFGVPLPTDACDRCYFMRNVAEEGVEAGVFIRSGEVQDFAWSNVKDNERHLFPSDEAADSCRWSTLWWRAWDEAAYYPKYIAHPMKWFQIFVLPGTPKPFPDFPVNEIGETTASAEGLNKVQHWLKICNDSHKLCLSRGRGLSLLPKRVLDVSGSSVKLHITNHETARYACLSHCWGDARPACRTTSSTIQRNQSKIEWNALPATFQDAVDFTRRLGIQYIWIDSVCIIQDNTEDWAEQSALMVDIYENAYVTLCATASCSDNEGLYSSSPLEWKASKLSAKRRDGVEYEFYIRENFEERHIPEWYFLEPAAVQRFPLMTRAWAYQERLLSPRLVHFTAGEIIWECSELVACECTQNEVTESSPFLRHLREKRTHQIALQASQPRDIEHAGGNPWHEIVLSFSGLDLSFGEDKLPALSGVAKQMLRQRPADEYLAGLWKSSIIADLRWMPHELMLRRPSAWRSPSWSWASLDGVVAFALYGPSLTHDYSRCVEAFVTTSSTDPTGTVSSGYIILSAPVVMAELEALSQPSLPPHEQGLSLIAAGLSVTFFPDCYSDFSDRLLEFGDRLLCLRLGNARHDDFCLVLKQRGGDETQPIYERVGHLFYDTQKLDEHWFPPKGINTLVKIV